MEITDVRMRLANDRTDRLKAFCTVTFDAEFVVRDIKVVEGASGLFIAMPSRKMSAPCPECRHKNQVRARYCEDCGKKLTLQPVSDDPEERMKLYRDIAHPITPAFREKLQHRIVEAYRVECEAAATEGEEDESFVDERDGSDDDLSSDFSDYDELIAVLRGREEPPSTRDRNGPPAPKGASRDRPPRVEGADSGGDRARRKRRRRRGRSSQDRPEDGRVEPAAAKPVDVPEPVLHEAGEQDREESPAQVEPDQPERRVVPAVADSTEPKWPSPPKPARVDEHKVAAETAKIESNAVADEDDDSTPFGAGIL